MSFPEHSFLINVGQAQRKRSKFSFIRLSFKSMAGREGCLCTNDLIHTVCIKTVIARTLVGVRMQSTQSCASGIIWHVCKIHPQKCNYMEFTEVLQKMCGVGCLFWW